MAGHNYSPEDEELIAALVIAFRAAQISHEVFVRRTMKALAQAYVRAYREGLKLGGNPRELRASDLDIIERQVEKQRQYVEHRAKQIVVERQIEKQRQAEIKNANDEKQRQAEIKRRLTDQESEIKRRQLDQEAEIKRGQADQEAEIKQRQAGQEGEIKQRLTDQEAEIKRRQADQAEKQRQAEIKQRQADQAEKQRQVEKQRQAEIKPSRMPDDQRNRQYAQSANPVRHAGLIAAAMEATGPETEIHWLHQGSRDDEPCCDPCVAAWKKSPYTIATLPGFPAEICLGLFRCHCDLEVNGAVIPR